MLKEMMRACASEPEKMLTREALAELHPAYATIGEQEDDQIRSLCLVFNETLRKELLIFIV